MSKPGKPRKAPRVSIPSKKKPNYMVENDKANTRKNPMAPMFKKKLSK
jgi:hypothetical protein